MSRIGKQPIAIPEAVKVSVDKNLLTVTGPRGNLTLTIPPKIELKLTDHQLTVYRQADDRQTRANHGTTRAKVRNMVQGVVAPWTKSLELRGTGYKFLLDGANLSVIVGFIHPVPIACPPGVTFQVSEDTKILISGSDKILVGKIASNIRKIKPPEPYKGKGIRYLNESVKLKAGKIAKA